MKTERNGYGCGGTDPPEVIHMDTWKLVAAGVGGGIAGAGIVALLNGQPDMVCFSDPVVRASRCITDFTLVG